MKIHDATAADLVAIRTLLSEANDMPYDIAPVAEEKCFGPGFSGPPEVHAYGDFEGLSVTCGKHLRILGVRHDSRRRGIGSALLDDAEARGARVIAAEPGNYFTPGVLESMAPFFAKRGYRETARTTNLQAELPIGGQTIPPAGTEGISCAAQGDRERVLEFIAREFSPIWRFEAERAAMIYYIEHEGRVAGFSTHAANNRALGWFGPTGVSKEARGLGFGRRLLLASLADLGRLGYHQTVIPWTDAIEFYRKSCGARIAHRFVTLKKDAH